MLPTESEENKNVGSEDASETTTTTEAITTTNTTDNASAVVNNDNLIESLDQQNSQSNTNPDDNPKLEQFLLDSLAAVVTSSSVSGVTSTLGLGGNGGSNQCSQNANDQGNEMPQLMSILNELLDGSDLSALTNTGGNGDTIQDMEDQEEAYEDDSPRKDDPDEIAKQIVVQRLEEISREEQQLHRKMDFLIRRLYKLVARSTGLHASEEIAGFVEHVARHYRRREKEHKEQNVSKSTSFQQLDATSNLQGSIQPNLTPPLSELPDNILSSPSKSQEPNAKDVIEINNKSVDTLKPVPLSEMKTFLRRIENISTFQSTNLSKQTNAMKYFAKPSSICLNSMSRTMINAITNNVPRFESEDAEMVDQVSGMLLTEMRIISKNVDSDATASSSGGESADEMIAYNNQYQQPLSISKRAAYKYAKDRGAVASRWCWLATQISELDYKIRQHTDLRKHIKENKGAIMLEEIAGFEGQLPGSSNKTKAYDTDDDEGLSSARVRPLLKPSFRKRKLVQTANLHYTSKKAARPSTIKCGCQWPIQPCALCTGRPDPTAPRDLPETLPTAERVALLDPCFHPVLSFPDDVSSNIHLEAIMNIPEWQSKMLRSSPKSIMKHVNRELELLSGGNGHFRDEQKQSNIRSALGDEKKMRKYNIDVLTGKRKYTKKLKLVDGGFVNKLKERRKYRKRGIQLSPGSPHSPRKYTFKKRMRKLNDGMSSYSHQNSHNNVPNGYNGADKHYDLLNRSKNSSPVPNHRSEKKISESRSNRNYDIDNIVIPYSVAASTRPEVLTYAEIPTPKWRIIKEEDNNSTSEVCNDFEDYDNEDISDEMYVVNHDRALLEERKKFETFLKFPLTSRSRANRRIDSRGNESSGANTPIIDPTTPPPGEFELTPSTTDGHDPNEPPSITALLNTINGRKERSRTTSRKEDDGFRSGTVSRCHSPSSVKEMTPAYEPLNFPLTEVCIQKMKRLMPAEQTGDIAKYHIANNNKIHESRVVASQRRISRPTVKRQRRHNDSISESKLIKEKLPSITTVGRTNNLLIARNKSHNILESIDLTAKDAAMLKQLMNNNNGDLGLNGDEFDDDTEDNIYDNSDSETVTGDESNCDLGDDSDSDFR